MSKFQVRFYAGEDDRLASWMVLEVLMDDGEGNRMSEIYAEFDPTFSGQDQARELAYTLNREVDEEIYAEFG